MSLTPIPFRLMKHVPRKIYNENCLANKYASKQANKQASKQADSQVSKQANEQTKFQCGTFFCYLVSLFA